MPLLADGQPERQTRPMGADFQPDFCLTAEQEAVTLAYRLI
jgi:hypothetical protein